MLSLLVWRGKFILLPMEAFADITNNKNRHEILEGNKHVNKTTVST